MSLSVWIANVWQVTVWSPGRRKNQMTLETPFEGVPKHLKEPLWAWVESMLQDSPGLIGAAGLELRLTLPNPMGPRGTYNAMQHLRALSADDGFLLDLAEYILENNDDPYSGQAARTLETVLTLANSAYKVREDPPGLEMRTMPETQQQVQEVVDSAGAAGAHLANAWNAAYSRTPDPVKSYSESIKAVETALVSKISPQNTKATLGTMIRDVASKPSKWTFAIADGDHSDGVGTVLGMMRVLWEGQRSRHGGPNTQFETPEEARTAVSLAATLVQFGVSGAFDLV